VDCECIGLTIHEKVNGEIVAADLEAVFMRAGTPQGIVKDCDATLQKGVRLWSERQGEAVHVIDNIGHSMANALRDEFEGTASYQRFTALVTQGANRLRQTDLAFLMPPKLRSKGRFQSIGNIGKWGGRMLDILAVKGGAKKREPAGEAARGAAGVPPAEAFHRALREHDPGDVAGHGNHQKPRPWPSQPRPVPPAVRTTP